MTEEQSAIVQRFVESLVIPYCSSARSFISQMGDIVSRWDNGGYDSIVPNDTTPIVSGGRLNPVTGSDVHTFVSLCRKLTTYVETADTTDLGGMMPAKLLLSLSSPL